MNEFLDKITELLKALIDGVFNTKFECNSFVFIMIAFMWLCSCAYLKSVYMVDYNYTQQVLEQQKEDYQELYCSMTNYKSADCKKVLKEKQDIEKYIKNLEPNFNE